MAHFARIDKTTKKVINVHVVDNINCLDESGKEVEQIGIDYLKEVHKNQDWINDVEFVQTSYNKNFRKHFAGIGFTWDKLSDSFIAPTPDIKTVVVNGKTYNWNELTNSWEEEK